MVVLDPLSAASRPMPDWSSMPSQPLPFAATLRSLDINTQPSYSSSSSQKLPRPRRDPAAHGLPKAFPPPAYGHVRHGSMSSNSGSRDAFLGSSSKAPVGSDEWMEAKVAHCVDTATSDLIITECGLETLSTKISELCNLVTLPQIQSPTASPTASPRLPRSPFPSDSPRQALASPLARPFGQGERSFARTQSAPASAAFFSTMRRDSGRFDVGGSSLLRRDSAQLDVGSSGLLPAADLSSGSVVSVREEPNEQTGVRSSPAERRLTRSKTGVVDLNRNYAKRPDIGVYASQNRLVSLPTALFEIRNLTVLTLRNNQLESLPAAVGELVHLRELNISNNRIRYLPSTILDLTRLEQFSAYPNPWLPRPEQATDSQQTMASLAAPVLSPLRSTHAREPPLRGARSRETGGPVPRLSALCVNVLLSPRAPHHLPPFIGYNWEDCMEGGKHPLLDVEVLQHIMPPCFQKGDLSRILQSVKSSCAAYSQGGGSGPRVSTRVDPFPRSRATSPPDDASANPYYHVCPAPHHLEWDINSPVPRTTRPLFLTAAEERFEWRTVAGVTDLPVQWLGCSPGCLAHLDEDYEDEWGIESDDE